MGWFLWLFSCSITPFLAGFKTLIFFGCFETDRARWWDWCCRLVCSLWEGMGRVGGLGWWGVGDGRCMWILGWAMGDVMGWDVKGCEGEYGETDRRD